MFHVRAWWDTKNDWSGWVEAETAEQALSRFIRRTERDNFITFPKDTEYLITHESKVNLPENFR